MSENFVFPEELVYFVESIRPYALQDVGSTKWIETHENIIKLSQQAVLEASQHRSEDVIEFIISHDKLKVLIREAYCILLWKTRVLTHLLEIDPNPAATFMIYTVFYHEGAVISLLDSALFHSNGCEALQDVALDLIDYSAQGVAQLIGLASMGHHENDSKFDVDESILTELERQKRDLIYKIGLRCISILNNLSDHSNVLSLSATRRLIVTHDVPWLMADLLHFRPWQRRTEKGIQKYIDDKWVTAEGDEIMKITKPEAQAWFCLRQLLLNTKLMEAYEWNEERRKHFLTIQGLLNETVLDQLPPLAEFKEYICQACISGDVSAKKKEKTNLLLEEVPEIREQLIIEAEKAGGFLAIAKEQEEIFLCSNKEKICELAQRINSAYNTDLLAEIEDRAAAMDIKTDTKDEEKTIDKGASGDGKKCGVCEERAEKKCANCRKVFYCSRKCQLLDWEHHKKDCIIPQKC